MIVLTQISPGLILMGGLILLLTAGVLTPQEAFSGVSNPGTIAVASIFGVAATMRETGVISLLVRRLLGRPKSLAAARTQIMLPVAVVGAFPNNTPVAAILMPAIDDWAKQNHTPMSKLLLSLSCAVILEGMCTLIGSSTNLVVNRISKLGGRV